MHIHTTVTETFRAALTQAFPGMTVIISKSSAPKETDFDADAVLPIDAHARHIIEAALIDAAVAAPRKYPSETAVLIGERLATCGYEIVRKAGYREALSLIRAGETSAAAIARALGDANADGEEGNVWKLLDLRLAIHRAERSLSPREERPLPRGVKITTDEVDQDPWQEEERSQTDEEAAAAHLAALEKLARESAPHSDGPDDIEERADGSVYVTSAGLAEIAGWSYGTAGRWFSRSGLSGQVDLAEVGRVLASQSPTQSRGSVPAGFEGQEIVRAIAGVRRYVVEHAGKRAAAADEARAAAARYDLIKALASAREVLAADEISALVSQAVGTGRAA